MAVLIWQSWRKRGVDLVHKSGALLMWYVLSIRTSRVQLRKVVVVDSWHDVASRFQPIGLIKDSSDGAQIIAASDRYPIAVIDVARFDVIWQEEELLYLLHLRDGKRNGHHWIERDWDTIALGAAYSALELTVEQVSDYWLISQEVLIPRLQGGFIFRLVTLLVQFNVGLLTFAIEVLTQEVQYRCDAFVAVMLAKALKLRRILTKNSFEHRWSHRRWVHVPHLINELGVGHDQASLCTERILLLEFINESESTFQEELR